MATDANSVSIWDAFPMPSGVTALAHWEELGIYIRLVRIGDTLLVHGYYPPLQKTGQARLTLLGQEPEDEIVQRAMREAVRYMIDKFRQLEAKPDGD